MIKLTNPMMVAALLVAAATGVAQASSSKVKTELAATASAPDARGKATAVVRSATKGRFEVKVKKLAANTAYDVVVGGIKVGSISTKNNGSAKIRFSSKPKSDDVLLGFDPRGDAIEIRGASGDDVLTGNLPADPNDLDGSDVACCIPDDSGTECEDRTEAECVAQGGTVTGAASCLPDPCGATPPADLDVVCCLPDDGGPECEDRTQAECAAQGGTVVEAASCLPENPCQGAPLPGDADVQCCLPDDSGVECEDRTAAECAAQGGIDKGAGLCTATSCDGL
ncbi:hypothetical protein K2Z84_06305 [Candidatus Binatia bacterium]|nr:hypothetical protein [Candidatus Binatia bacterium]